MRAVLVREPGGPEQLLLGEAERPEPASDELLVKVAATAVNRADTLQRQGKYPPPKGASPLLGLEMAGEVVAVGAAVTRHQVGDRVFGLLPGGGYAEYAVIHEQMALPMPDEWSYAEAAAVPEVFLTAFQALMWLGELQAGEQVLIHAGASGVGTAAIQLAKAMEATVLVTASAGKHALCRELGADHTIDYQQGPFAPEVQQRTGGRGVDLIVDFIAAPYFSQNISLLKTDGRLVLLATLGGGKVDELDLRTVLSRRLSIKGSTLRARSRAYQIRLTEAFQEFAFNRLREGQLRPVIDRVLPWSQAAEAHRLMEANENAGKIILSIEE
ncbi:putative NAD(P)H quinone oxidoreductase, PIG3 family [Catalinimonas alkaloidigena]|uniref:Putative NAD(P)H quinone oxidoreductase, PIG3 family n=2 Tax=Catalinimonas alkaloidigena TaxID=1075417 RepID=A0A1G9SIF7_9BACT|nr:putative NAD(P)H quinone oxidoreductase, PIG3 family [Catalinimonas alkaloidigena]